MRRLRWYDYITINLFWLGLNIRNTAMGSIFMPYLVDAFVRPEVKNTALGALRTAGLIIAMLVQPAMGLLSDRSTSRFGRRRPFIFVGVLLDLVFLAAVGLSRTYGALLIATLLQQFSANVSHGALQGLIPDIVPEDQHGRASAVKSIFELLPIILVGFTIAKLVGSSHLGWAIVATGGGLLLTMVLTVWLVKEEPLRQKPATSLAGPMLRVLGILAGIAVGAAAGLAGGAALGGLVALISWPLAGKVAAQTVGLGVGGLVAMSVAVVVGVWAGALGTLGRQARQQSSFVWWIVNRLLFLAAVTSIQGFAPYFLMYAFGVSREGGADMTGSLIGVVGIFMVVTALPSGWLADRVGPRRLVGLGGLVAAAGTVILLGTIWVPSLPLIYVAGCIIGLAAGLFMTTNWSLGTSLVPSAEAGRYLGISNLAGAGAGMVGAGLGGPMADALNRYRPGLGYFAIFACYAVLFVLSAVSLLGVRGVRHGT
jgi:MFS family permease